MLGRTGTMVALAVLLACPVLAPAQPADLIIRNGRVIDPESGLDEVRTVLVSGGQISDVTATDVAAERIAESTTVVDASGLVVAPGRPVTACPMTACNGRKPASG
jgi:adenine deaminase